MPTPLKLARCCGTCRYFERNDRSTIGICRLAADALEQRGGEISRDDIVAIYTIALAVCDRWRVFQRPQARLRISLRAIQRRAQAEYTQANT